MGGGPAAWPFHDGLPMCFITQYDVPRNPVTATLLSADETLYVFGARDGSPERYRMVYAVVSQTPGLRTARACAARLEAADEGGNP